MANKKIVAVMGATGAQGGGLVRAIQDDKAGEFQARAILKATGDDPARFGNPHEIFRPLRAADEAHAAFRRAILRARLWREG